MKNIPFESKWWRGIPREVQLQRIKRLIREQMTPCQREVLLAYYFQGMTVAEIAAYRGVHKTTVWRTLRRAEENLRRYLKY